MVLIKGLPMFPEGGQVGCKSPCRLITPRTPDSSSPRSPNPQLPKDEPEGREGTCTMNRFLLILTFVQLV